MQQSTHTICAFEVGSSKISGLIAERKSEDLFHILAYDSVSSSAFVRKGRIVNIDQATAAVIKLKEKLQTATGLQIHKAYIAINPLSLRSENNTAVHDFGEEEQRVTEEIVGMLSNDNGQKQTVGREILNVITQEYRTSNRTVFNPEGELTRSLVASFVNITIESEAKMHVEKCFQEAGIKALDTPTSAEAAGLVALSEQDKQRGCILVDMGASVTSVSVYKNGQIGYLRLIPLGGHNITLDLCNLKEATLDEADAEWLKLKSGSAYTESRVRNRQTEQEKEYVSLPNGRGVPLDSVERCTAARAEEIAINVAEQIRNSLLLEEGKGIVYLIGGNANLREMANVIKFKTDREVRLCTEIRTSLHLTGTTINLKEMCAYSLLGAAYQCGDHCVSSQIEETPITREGDLFTPEPSPTVPQSTNQTVEPEVTPLKPKTETKRNNLWGQLKNKLETFTTEMTQTK